MRNDAAPVGEVRLPVPAFVKQRLEHTPSSFRMPVLPPCTIAQSWARVVWRAAERTVPTQALIDARRNVADLYNHTI